MQRSSYLTQSQFRRNISSTIQQYTQFGFHPEVIYQAYRNTNKNPQLMFDELLKLQNQKNQNMSILTKSSQQIVINDEIINKMLKNSTFQNSAKSEIKIDPRDCIREDNKPVGLKNLGSTCYFNSIIQTLYHTNEIRESILNLNFSSNNYNKKYQTVLREFQFLFAKMYKGKKNYQDTKPLFEAFSQHSEYFKIGEQNDFYEFQNIIFELMDNAFTPEGENKTMNQVMNGHGQELQEMMDSDDDTIILEKSVEVRLPLQKEESIKSNVIYVKINMN